MKTYTAQIAKFIQKEAPWLNEFPWYNIRLRELPSWLPFVGIYLPFLKLILVKPEPDSDELTFATYVHELRHAWQYHNYGALKYLIKKAFCRNEIEADAENWEMIAVEAYRDL